MLTLLRVFFLMELSLVAAAQSTNSGNWRVWLADASNTKLSASINSGVIEFRTEKTVALTIPATSITEVFHSTQRIRRSTKAYSYFERMCCGGTQSQLLPALAWAIASPFGQSKDHYVEIHWYLNGDRAAVLGLAKGEYVDFLDWLQQVSGTTWVDVEQEREQALKRIEQRAGAAFPVWLTHGSAGDSDPGALRYYYALPLDLHGRTELYFFRNKVKPKNLVGILPVAEEWADNSCVADVEVLYGKCREDGCDLEAILLPTLTYHVMSPPQVTETDAAGHYKSDCAKLAQQQLELSKQDESDSRVTLRRRPDR